MNTAGQSLFLLANVMVAFYNYNNVLFPACANIQLVVNNVVVSSWNNYRAQTTGDGISKLLTAYLPTTPTGNFVVSLRGNTKTGTWARIMSKNTGVMMASGGASFLAIGLKR